MDCSQYFDLLLFFQIQREVPGRFIVDQEWMRIQV